MVEQKEGMWTSDLELTDSIPAIPLSCSDLRQVVHTHAIVHQTV